jgi:peptidoglycan/xylan/chitin deacetylase (PgdA/CDA1 family)
MLSTLRNSWRKNWPECQAAITGGLPNFISSSDPHDLWPSIPVFCYHVVNVKDFEADLIFLSRNGYVTIGADALLDHLELRCSAPKRSVVLSIDDGARNLYEVAFPLLQRHAMKAVAFIAPRFHKEDWEYLKDEKIEALPPLSWSQIWEMHASGIIDFQSHTYEHRFVPRWPEPVGLEGSSSEVVRSLRGPALKISEDFRLAKKMLEEKLGKTVRHLAFPTFNGTKEALRIGHECGYRAFWWGVLPHRPGNTPGESPSFVVRVDGRYLRRLPGEERESLTQILRTRYSKSLSRLLRSSRNKEQSKLRVS